ncbi:4-amino-4-deoxy-L-arabinose transferase-like glycosyltransferase [Dysgonomonas sp. PH5-45]|uniref:ArnT family glycosyltransferase n=1 Tax=unclassified Dysgonomonas TaxID=2630389 RepID=UPI0024746EA0|nr:MULTISPECIES: glycosyltransferase family 39 protein [unclassified Dysgonomonas]MDH6353972.1 4-amino-4-deoxy-L-arabinose transferase-like glycosyltransferase [Dysgonomonas sp. PH5-45]MDH6386874.1 4-amino-4-deoxy-L-arabinose transferase-like glycosyltransferase [Dysgonomonas sp. PH5-37]
MKITRLTVGQQHYLIILIVSFFAFFVNNHIIPADLMESRNLATAQEMVHSSDFLIPRMNGELRLEKPPLPTWVAAVIETAIPENIVAQRCAAGIMATVMAFFLYLLVVRLTKNRSIGLISALILASCFNIILMGRTATWDIYCHSFMLGAIYFMVAGFQEKGAQYGRFLLAGLFMGLSFLGKGPVSFFALLLPFLIAYIAIYRPNVRGKIGALVLMVLVCLIIAFWWPLYIMAFHKEFAVSVAQKESTSWINRNVRPWYYYWQFPAEAGIWALFWITSLMFFYWKNKFADRKAYIFSIVWTFSAIVLLSCFPEKKTRYLLPILIPGAINTAFYIHYCIEGLKSKGERMVFRINASVIGIILLAIPVALFIMFMQKDMISIPLYVTITVLSLALSAFIFISAYTKDNNSGKKVFTGIILTMIMVEAFCLIPIGKTFINDDRHSIRMLRTDKRVEGLPFFYNEQEGEIRMELVFESDKIIRPLNPSKEQGVYSNLPFVFLSGASIDSIFAGKNVVIEHIDTFDNNWQKKTSRKHKKELVRQVAIIKPIINQKDTIQQ